MRFLEGKISERIQLRYPVFFGIPEPKFEEHQGFRVVFRKDIYTEEYLQKLGLNERQIKAVMYVKQKGGITNREYREMFNIKNRMALIDLSDLCRKGILTRVGKTGRGTEYILIGQTRNKPAISSIHPSPLTWEREGVKGPRVKRVNCIMNVS